MNCLSDKKLILYISSAIANRGEHKRIESHILGCDECFQKYFEILQIIWRSEVFKEDSNGVSYYIDFIVNPEEADATNPVNIFSQHVSLKVLEHVTRSDHANTIFQIRKPEHPALFLQKIEESGYWSLSFEDSIPALSLVSKEKIYYQASYQKRTRILLERGLLYHLFFGEKPAFLFKLY